MELQGEREVRAAIPTIVWQECRAGDEIVQGGNVGRRSFRSLARNQVELRQLFAFLTRADLSGAAVELIDDLENPVFERIRRGMRRQQPADSEMSLRPPALWDQGIGGFLNAIVKEAIRIS